MFRKKYKSVIMTIYKHDLLFIYYLFFYNKYIVTAPFLFRILFINVQDKNVYKIKVK